MVMPKKKPLTTKRGQHHKYKSFWINLIKDATWTKIDSNMLRNKPEAFEKKKVTFEKKNSDPSYFQKTLCTAFPSLHGRAFSLCRLICTNAKKDKRMSLDRLSCEINNAVDLCDCKELKRSCLYIKLQKENQLLDMTTRAELHSSQDTDYMTEEERQISLIRRHLDFLVDRIDPDFGLLDVMITHKDLTMAQYHQVRSMPSTVEERNRKLLNCIIDQKKPDRLIAGLADSRQMHLANYLNSDGAYQDTFHGVWPMSKNELEKLILNRKALIDGLDASYLSFNLYFKGVIDKRQHEFILCKPTNSEKNEVMLEILRHGSIDHYKQTIEALKELKHDCILKVLEEYEEDIEQIQVIEEQLEQEKNEKEQERKKKQQKRKKKEEHSRELEETKQLVSQLQARRVSKRRRTKIKPESELEREQREEEQQRLIDALPVKYKLDPVLIHTITTEVKPDIKGFTILDGELYVVRAKCSEVEVYNSIKFSFSRRWNLKELMYPTDIVSCNRNKCLYIYDFQPKKKSRGILRVDPNGKLIRKWSTGDDFGLSLSVTDELNVILAVSTNSEEKLNEYSPDGQLVREINLSDAGISFPHHAIKLASGHFLVTHGVDLPGVCVVDADGNLEKSFDGKCGSTIEHFGSPVYVAIDGNGFVMVVDEKNDRVLLLDLELEFKRVLLSQNKQQFRDRLTKILVNQTTNQLLVIDGGDILIFSLSSEK